MTQDPRPNTQHPIDVSGLEQLRRLQTPGKPDVVARIAGKFLDETDERLATLHQAVTQADAAEIERAAHALKGIAGTVGANEIREVANQLERVGREGRTDGAQDLVAALDTAMARARPVYERLRSGT
jgi:two-component system sensor histidine kinase/response regulator